MSSKQTIFISSVQKELAPERRAGTKLALSQGSSRDQVEILFKASIGAAFTGFVAIAKGMDGTKSRHQVPALSLPVLDEAGLAGNDPARQTHQQPAEIPSHRARCGVAGQTGHKWAKWAMNDMKFQKRSNAQGGRGLVHQLFGAEWPKVIEELNRELAA